MKNLLLLLLCFSFYLSAQNIHSVTINVYARGVLEGESVYITGNIAEIGNWNPSKKPLHAEGNGNFSLKFFVNAGTELQFKFTKGSWETEAIYEKGKVPPNWKVLVVSDTILNYSIQEWKDTQTVNVFGQITGTVKYHTIAGIGRLQSREIIVWLPPGYDSDSSKRYPVLYMHDGQNIINPATSTFGRDWQADETADSLIRMNIIEPIIIVGIYNTGNRYEEYMGESLRNIYMEFVVNSVKKTIDSLYRTKPDRRNTAVAGSSAGGAITFLLYWNYPHIFSKAACFSPAFMVANFDMVSPLSKENLSKEPGIIYIDNGGQNIDSVLQYGVTMMNKKLETLGFERGKNLHVVIEPDADHNEIAWAQRLPNVLKLFFGK